MLKKLGMAVLAAGLFAVPAIAQDGQYGEKLGFMPRSNTNAPLIGGTGNVEASLDGTTLTISGEYSGLRGDATTLAIHTAAPGMVGPEIGMFELEGGQEGSFSDSIELDDEQVELLNADSIYVIVKTSRNDKGELRAWLMSKNDE